MVYKKRYIFIILTLTYFIGFKFVFADKYEVYLYYDKNSEVIVADKSVNPNIIYNNLAPIPKMNYNDIESTKFGYNLISENTVIMKGNFAPNVSEGKFILDLPVTGGDDSKIQILSNGKVTEEFVLENPTPCNQNSVCEYEKGETELGCIIDCYYDKNTKKPIVYSTKTEQTLQSNNGIIRDQEGTILIKFQDEYSSENNSDSKENLEETKPPIWPLILGIVLLFGGFAVFVYWRIKKKNQ